MKRILLLCMLLSVSIIQSKGEGNSDYWSIRAGVNFANFTNSDYTSDCQTGFNVGVNRAFSISKQLPVYIQSGLSFEMKGSKNSYNIDGVEIKSDAKTYALEIPVLINYGFTISKKSTIIPFVGIYYSFAVGGSWDHDGESSNPYKEREVLFAGDEVATDTRILSHSDWGIRVGLDYKYLNYSIGVAYDAGLSNIYAKEFRDRNYDASTGSFSINLGYYF